MKQKIKKLLTCVGAVGALTMMLSVPVLADTKEDYDWSDKAAADVNTYATFVAVLTLTQKEWECFPLVQ